MSDNVPTLRWLFFSFQGRIARKSYLMSVLFLLLPQIIVVLQMVQNADNDAALAFWFLVWIAINVATLWSLLALAVKRLHDLSVTGWLALILFVPTVNWIFLLALAFIPSKQETNQWGPPPFPVDLGSA